MPRRCCVPMCISNYKSGENCTVFRFTLNNPEQLKIWKNNINRENFEPNKNTVVCIKHFESQFVVTEDKLMRNDGTELIYKRKIPKLTSDAVSSIFNNKPRYLLRPILRKRKAPEERTLEQNLREVRKRQEFETQDEIEGLENLKYNHEIKLLKHLFNVSLTNCKVVFYKVNVNEKNTPEISCSVLIESDVSCTVMVKNCKINDSDNNISTILENKNFSVRTYSTLILKK